MIYCDTRIGYPPQNHNDIEVDVNPLCQFRQELHASFDSRADGIMNLLDAPTPNTNAKSVAELSGNPIFNYQYASVYDAIDPFFSASPLTEAERQRRQKEIETINLILSYLPVPVGRQFWLFALDTTSTKRPYAHTLADRGVVQRFALKEQETWTPPDEEATLESVTRRGRKLTIELLGWHHLLMRGKQKHPMHKSPFTLIRVRVRDTDGKRVFKRPLWLTVTGTRRDHLSIQEIYSDFPFRWGFSMPANSRLPQ